MAPITRMSNLQGFRESVDIASLSEIATAQGLRYNHYFDNVFTASETKYFLYEVPDKTEFGYAMALQRRVFKTESGSAELEILWNVDSYVPGTPEKVYNQYNKYTTNGVVEVSEIAPVTGGEVREPDFITGTPGGFFTPSSGDLTDSSGFRVYNPGTYFIAKITNTHSAANRIILAYDWIEVPRSFLKL